MPLSVVTGRFASCQFASFLHADRPGVPGDPVRFCGGWRGSEKASMQLSSGPGWLVGGSSAGLMLPSRDESICVPPHLMSSVDLPSLSFAGLHRILYFTWPGALPSILCWTVLPFCFVVVIQTPRYKSGYEIFTPATWISTKHQARVLVGRGR
jgi:hypothetical protein